MYKIPIATANELTKGGNIYSEESLRALATLNDQLEYDEEAKILYLYLTSHLPKIKIKHTPTSISIKGEIS